MEKLNQIYLSTLNNENLDKIANKEENSIKKAKTLQINENFLKNKNQNYGSPIRKDIKKN